MKRPLILAVSDATGETAIQLCRAAMAQFGPVDDAQIHTIAHVLHEADLEKAVLAARQLGSILVYTLVGPELRTRLKELAFEHEVPSVDVLGSLIARIAQRLGRPPLSVPGLGHELDEDYFRRIEAVEFAVYNDDGREPKNLHKADIVIVGISRTSKTPLSNYIAHRGYKVANVPLVLGVALPPELDQVDPRRVFALSIDPAVLVKIRQARMEALRMHPGSNYGDIRHVREEVNWAQRQYAAHPGWTVLNVSRKAVEETASRILEVYRAYFEGAVLSDTIPETVRRSEASARTRKPTSRKKGKKKTAKRKSKKTPASKRRGSKTATSKKAASKKRAASKKKASSRKKATAKSAGRKKKATSRVKKKAAKKSTRARRSR